MEDRAIVELYWKRDPAAIDVTARQYGGYCRAIAARLLPDGRDAEECVNDTWLGACLFIQKIPFRKQKKFPPEGPETIDFPSSCVI